ncbi:MAG: hypothetical protein WBA91_05270, partial [Paracoccaceae bacterium]
AARHSQNSDLPEVFFFFARLSEMSAKGHLFSPRRGLIPGQTGRFRNISPLSHPRKPLIIVNFQ